MIDRTTPLARLPNAILHMVSILIQCIGSRRFAMATIIVMLPETAGAVPLTFSNESDFLSASGTLVLEHFEELEATEPNSNPIATLFFTMDPTFTADGLAIRTDGVGATDNTDNWIEMAPLNVGVPAGAVIVNFLFPTTTFGMNVFDWGDLRTGTLTLGTNSGHSFTVATSPLPDENRLFFGLIADEPFNAVVITSTTGSDGLGFDEFYFAVPEPSTLGLVMAGLSSWLAIAFGRSRHSEPAA